MQAIFTASPHPTEPRPPAKGFYKSPVACSFCRAKKIKCNGGSPCPNCIDHGEQCTYVLVRRRRNPKDYKTLQERLARVEALLSTSHPQPSLYPIRSDEHVTVATVGHYGQPPSTAFSPRQMDAAASTPPGYVDHSVHARPEAIPPLGTLPSMVNMALPSLAPTPAAQQTDTTETESSFLAPGPSPTRSVLESPREDDGEGIFPQEEELTFEYHGPGSFLSICSRSGIEWVAEKTGVTDFVTIAKCLATDVSRALKLPAPIPVSREPEPDARLAWAFSEAYFERDTDARYGIVYRPTFESMLRAHLGRDRHSDHDADTAWYALRNAVYAAGCRVLDTKASGIPTRTSFLASRSWKYFLNALSVHTDLLYVRTSLLAVQALTMMSFYVEAIACPSIDDMLCTNAMKLAEAKGIHRQPAAAWNLGTVAIQSRSFLWWAIYGYERQNAVRAGRPLAIDDDDITCAFPTEVPIGSRMNLEVVQSAISHARLYGRISKRIAGLKLLRPSVPCLSDTIRDLSSQLDSWWDGIPRFLKQDIRTPPRDLPQNVHYHQVIYFHHAYYGCLVAIHSVLVHPWNATAMRSKPDQREEYARLVATSTDIFVDATRRFIRNLPQIKINVMTPKWLAFTYPLTALINLFIYIIQQPQGPAIEDDVNLMYVIAGHFSYLEFAIPDRSYHCVGQIANLARLAVCKARESMGGNGKVVTGPDGNRDRSRRASSDNSDLIGGGNVYLGDLGDTEEWATLLGWPDEDSLHDEMELA